MSTRIAALKSLRRGAVFRFAEPFSDEDPEQVYVLVEDPSGFDRQGPYELNRVDISPVGEKFRDWAILPTQRISADTNVVVLGHVSDLGNNKAGGS